LHTRKASLAPKKSHLWRNYGMTLDDAQAMLEKQNGCCDICVKPFNGRPNIDHNHSTRKVRAMLCFTCNNHLRGVEDVSFRRRALEYLSKHEAQPGPFSIRAYEQRMRDKRANRQTAEEA
jgi:hypothetical protein